jgi:acyl-CoA synthetase (AMP-forming)/AMP-acid ligase II
MYLTQGLHRALQRDPESALTICGDRTRTVREVADRVAALAGALRALGVGDGDRVAMLSQNSDYYSEYLLAVPWANAVLNPVNVRWSAAEIAYSLADSETALLIVDEAFAPLLPDLLAAYSGLKAVLHCGTSTPAGALSYEQVIAEAVPIPDARRGGDALAGLFYTGGTTGFPKGVMLSHANLISSALGAAASGYVFKPGGTYLHAAPMFHLADLAGWTAQMMLGGTHVMVPGFAPVPVMEAIQAHGVTDAILVPAMIQMLVDHPDVAKYDLSSLERILFGASPITEAVLQRAMSTLPKVEFAQAFGMTELSPIATLLGPEEHRAGNRLRSAGRAAPHTEVQIVDGDGNEVPRGSVGEIAVRGGNVMQGYWQKPEATAEALRDGWMHTGDGAFMDDDGYVFIVDRLKDMIVSGGENVYSYEVENAIAGHPCVAASAVIGVPDEEWGERVHAVIVLQPGHSLTLDELRAHTKTRIAGYKAPRSVEFVDALPVSGAGKILKRELRAKYWTDSDRAVN